MTEPIHWIPFLSRIADEADAIALRLFRHRSLKVLTKADASPVSEADQAIEAAARRLLAAHLWDLAGWARDARELGRELGRLLGRLESGDRGALAPSSLVSAAVLRHFVADPLLPPELLPARWPGDALRADYDRFDVALRRVLQAWAREHRQSR